MNTLYRFIVIIIALIVVPLWFVYGAVEGVIHAFGQFNIRFREVWREIR